MSAGTFVRDPKDTIVAIASVIQPGERGIVRLTGPKTVDVLSSLGFEEEILHWIENCKRPGRRKVSFRHPLFSHTDQKFTVPADLWFWPNQRTYTGQVSAELHLEGAPVLLDSVLQGLIAGGARAAGPGEFTMRAFLAGRLDLVQAEAVLGVIHADNPEQLKLGLQRLGGGLSTPLERLRDNLILLLSDLEAGLDFVEEDIEFVSNDKLIGNLEDVLKSVHSLIDKISTRSGHQEKPVVCLVGPPNAGKSSLFNLLGMKQNQAIVSDQAGTTRDFVSADAQVGSVKYRLIDTAGIEDLDFTTDNVPTASENIDQMSWKQSWETVRHCDLVLFCFPAAELEGAPAGEVELGECARETDYQNWLKRLPADRTKVLLMKSDLLPGAAEDSKDGKKDAIVVSSIQRTGLEEVRALIRDQLQQKSGRHIDPDGLLGPRAAEALSAIETSIVAALELAINQVGEELIAMDLHCAVDELGKLVGTIYTDDLLDSIFSRFCIGK